MSHIDDALEVILPGERLTGNQIADRIIQTIDPRATRCLIGGAVSRAALHGLFHREPAGPGRALVWRYWPASEAVLSASGYTWRARNG